MNRCYFLAVKPDGLFIQNNDELLMVEEFDEATCLFSLEEALKAIEDSLGWNEERQRIEIGHVDLLNIDTA